MDHAYITENNVVERYVLNRLPSDDSPRFEEHLLDCAQCQGQLATTQDFSQALRAATEADPGLFRLEERRSAGAAGSWRWAFIGATACMLLAVPALLLSVRETRQLKSELSQASGSSDLWKQKYEAERQLNADMQKQLTQPKGQQSAGAMEELPVVAVVFPLNITRGGEPDASSAPDHIVLTRTPQLVVLSLDLDGNEFLTYRATLSRSSGQAIWKRDGLAPSLSNTLGISLPSKSFEPGDYLLTLEGQTRGGSYTPAGHYAFRVSFNQ